MSSAARQLLSRRPASASAVREVPEAAPWLEHEANLVALLAVPDLLKVAVSDGAVLRRLVHDFDTVAAPLSSEPLDYITGPARLLLGEESAWCAASGTRDFQIEVAGRMGSPTGLAVALVRAWCSQDEVGRQLAAQPQLVHSIASGWHNFGVPYLREGSFVLTPVKGPKHRCLPPPPPAPTPTAPPLGNLVVAFGAAPPRVAGIDGSDVRYRVAVPAVGPLALVRHRPPLGKLSDGGNALCATGSWFAVPAPVRLQRGNHRVAPPAREATVAARREWRLGHDDVPPRTRWPRRCHWNRVQKREDCTPRLCVVSLFNLWADYGRELSKPP